jgi:chromatin remodeling complex protein RSC6
MKQSLGRGERRTAREHGQRCDQRRHFASPDACRVRNELPGRAYLSGTQQGREQASRERMMAQSREKRGEVETKAAVKKVKATGKPVGGARGGITAPVTPSPELAEIVGKADLPRSEVVKKVWDYIKKNDLQDAKDRRQINGDDKLSKIFGKKSVSMFEMNKHLSAHLTAKKA